MGSATLSIVLLSVIATVLRMAVTHENLESTIDFATFVLNSLSLLWLCIVLRRHEKSHHADFGEAIRREMPTLLIALFISLIYSVVMLFRMLFR